MKIVIAILIALTPIAAGYWYFLYPPNAMKRQMAAELSDFAHAVGTKDREEIVTALQELMADPSKVRIILTFTALDSDGKSVSQDFDRETLATLVDNVLYAFYDYGYEDEPYLVQFDPARDGRTALMKIASKDWGEGRSYNGGLGLIMRYDSQTNCEARALFTGPRPRIEEAICKLQIRIKPAG